MTLDLAKQSDTPQTDALWKVKYINGEVFSWTVPQRFAGLDAMRAMETELSQLRAECERLQHDIARHVQITTDQQQEIERLRRDAERYAFLKSRIEVPGAVHHFLALNNWHPDTDLRDVDAAIDAASAEGERG